MQSTVKYWIVFIITLSIMGSSPFAYGEQQDADLRREVTRLTAELERTTRELEAARARIAELDQEVSQLRRARTTDNDDRRVDEEVTIDESTADASPRALFNAMVDDFNNTVEGMEIGRPDDRERALYMRTLTRWQAAAGRKFRSPVEWHVRVVNETQTRAGYDLRLEAIDPSTHVQLGDAFDISLPRSIARRYETMRDQDETNVMILRGTLIPMVNINPERSEPGPFDNPRLIGPFMEFGFTVEARSLLRPTDES